MGGEKEGMGLAYDTLQGSPPHGRGKAAGQQGEHGVPGITPAWAGKSPPPRQSACGEWDHPRMGGEKGPDSSACQYGRGSPPHGRGKVAKGGAHHVAQGITPAWAGKRAPARTARAKEGDHPRMGGEKPSRIPDPGGKQGSPPHGRGKAAITARRQQLVRITPAWAGKSVHIVRTITINQDHPRMGGEKSAKSSAEPCEKGSPPHGRGKVDRVSQSSKPERITPAWAGKRQQPLLLHPLFWDHPRMGGEKAASLIAAEMKAGSPPHGRGKADVCSTLEVSARITPAWAGKSQSIFILFCGFRDHPRMGGEKKACRQLCVTMLGSPPHGRGKGQVPVHQLAHEGITPAWAGKRHQNIGRCKQG